jgi:hypothetical protein
MLTTMLLRPGRWSTHLLSAYTTICYACFVPFSSSIESSPSMSACLPSLHLCLSSSTMGTRSQLNASSQRKEACDHQR